MASEAFDKVKEKPDQPFPRRKDWDIQDNLQSIATGCMTHCDMSREDSEKVALAVFDAPEAEWRDWKTNIPTEADGQIIGRDVLGFYHFATHMIGGRDPADGQWAEVWMPVPTITT